MTAAALFMHSSNSLSGTLSATIPAPERINTLLLRAKAILIEMDANDAAIVLVGSAAVGAGMPSGLTAEQETAGDVNADGTFNAIDAALILQYGVLAGTSSGLTFEDFLKQFA